MLSVHRFSTHNTTALHPGCSKLAAEGERQHLRTTGTLCMSVCECVFWSVSESLWGPSWAGVKQSNHPSRQWGEENMAWITGFDSFNHWVNDCILSHSEPEMDSLFTAITSILHVVTFTCFSGIIQCTHALNTSVTPVYHSDDAIQHLIHGLQQMIIFIIS